VFSSTATTQTVTGLTNGVAYTFTVRALDGNGNETTASNKSNSVTPVSRIPTFASNPAQAAPVLVQNHSQQVQTGTTNTLAFAQNTTAGNLIVVSIVWDNVAGVDVSDSQGNTYVSGAARRTWGTSWSAKTVYVNNIAGGADTVTVGFFTPITSFATVSISEYAGIDEAILGNPVDVTATGTGTGSAMTSGAITTTNSSDLLYGFGASNGAVTDPGTGFTTRSMTFETITEDRFVSSAGPYAATATQNSTAWVMQMIAFRAEPPGVATGAFPRTVRAADLNGDGHLDLAMVGGIGVSVLLGDGTGGFGPHAEFSAGSGVAPVAVAVGDVNGDGHLDLAVASTTSNGGAVSVLLGDGTGAFGPATVFPVLSGDVATSVAVGDLNGDGFADVVAADDYAVVVLIGDGSGTNFTTTGYPAGPATVSVQIADVNSDNLPDLVVGNEGSPGNRGFRPGVEVLFGVGAGAFAGMTLFPVPGFSGVSSVAVADVNGDSHADVVATNADNSNTLQVLFGDGAGNFPTQTTFPTGVTSGTGPPAGQGDSWVAIGDPNSDGFPDLVVTGSGSRNVSVLTGDGTGAFGPATVFATGDNPLSVVIGNIDGDTRPDLVVANNYSGSVSVLLNTTPPTTPPAPTMLRNATAADQSATMSWATPAGDGGSPITGYVITPYIGFDEQPSVTFNSTATTQTVTGLTNGTTYRFKVAAINAVGFGPMSTATNPVTPGV
jgi:hypothetical protein